MAQKKTANKQLLLMGNEAIGRGLVEAGLHFMTSYPGTPSSEILPSVVRFAGDLTPPPYCEWSINEKVALETALSAAYTGKRTAVAMKQVGLNVALDPLMSAAYIGVIGGFLVVCADDPGPHSSQTEQDTRLMAHFAKLPVFDPESPADARDMVAEAFDLSERFQIPVIFRPTLRVCHARQNLSLKKPKAIKRPANFVKDPFRWAAIPKMRLALHHALNDKLAKIADYVATRKTWNVWHAPLPEKGKAKLGIIAGGVAGAMARDVLEELGLPVAGGKIPFLQLKVPYPLPTEPVRQMMEGCAKILVIEEPEPVIEMLAPLREKILGRLSGDVPNAGELTPDVLQQVLTDALAKAKIKVPKKPAALLSIPDQPSMRRPNLCPGCPHRNVFFNLRKNFPTALYPSDIGCYTLGLNQGAVDTCHNMGAAVTFAAAFSRVHEMDGGFRPVIGTIGDSTFYHSGATALTSAVYNGYRFILVVLDNETTGMTGMQPTPESGLTADGHPGKAVDLIGLIKGCGVENIQEVDSYDQKGLSKALRNAGRYIKKADGGVAVIVARHACVAHRPKDAVPVKMPVTVAQGGVAKPAIFDAKAKSCIDCGRCAAICPAGAIKRTGKARMKVDAKKCTSCRLCASVCPTGTMVLEAPNACVACGLCTTWFVCPALVKGPNGQVSVDPSWCIECGMCLEVCQNGAITKAGGAK